MFVGDFIRKLHMSAHPDPDSPGFWCELEKGVLQFYETGEVCGTFFSLFELVLSLSLYALLVLVLPMYLSGVVKVYTPSRRLQSFAESRILCIP